MRDLITDPGFDLNLSKEFKLSIQVSLNGFSFSVIHEEQKKLLALETFPLSLSSEKFLGRRLKEWLDDNETFNKTFASTRVIVDSKNFTFIPSEYYDFNNQEIPAQLVLGKQEQSVIIDNYLANANGNIVFTVPLQVMETVKSKIPESKLLHPVVLLDSELHKRAIPDGSSIVLYFMKQSFFLLYYNNSMLEMINSYRYATPDDVLYYTLSIIKQQKQASEKTILYLAGEIIPESELHYSLKRLFNRTIFLLPEIHFNSDIFKETLHRYIVLF